MNKYKYHISILVILIVIIGYFIWPQSPSLEVLPSVKSSLPTSSIKPAKINEPFKTWYFGDIAVDIPESMVLDGQLQFTIRPDAENRNITIGFSDISADEAKNKEYRLTSSEPLSRPIGSQVFSWEPATQKTQDISAIIGQPAGLSIFYGPDKVDENRWALGMDVRLKEDYGYLEFAFTELILGPLSSERLESFSAQKEMMLLSWITDFLNAYNLTGHNQKPGPGQLATQLGIINIDGSSLISDISFMAFFASTDDTHRPLYRNQIALTKYFTTDICSSKDNLADDIYEHPSTGNIGIYKDWMRSIDSAIYGSICVMMKTIALTGGNDLEAQSHVMGLSNEIFNSLRSAI